MQTKTLYESVVEILNSVLRDHYGFTYKKSYWVKEFPNAIVKFHIRKSQYGLSPNIKYGLVLKKFISEGEKFGAEDFHLESFLEEAVDKTHPDFRMKWHKSADDAIEVDKELLEHLRNALRNEIGSNIIELAESGSTGWIESIEKGEFSLCYLRRSDLNGWIQTANAIF
jgi:hypothetical protein